MKKVLVSVPVDSEQKKQLQDVSSDYEFHYPGEKNLNLSQMEIIIGNVSAEKLQNCEKLRWLQTASVGVDKYIRKGVLNDEVILTNAVDIHTREVSQHCLAVLLMMIKKIHLYHNDQKKHLWKDEGMVKELDQLKVCILGLGNIGKDLARMLKALHVYVIGVKRTKTEKPDCVDELYLKEDLSKAIRDVDALISILPGNKENENFLTIEHFRQMRSDSVFINAGRGNLCSEETIRQVLDEKIIAGMALDVFVKEPLPKDSPLWDYENLVITPHAAGSYHLKSAKEAFIALCVENLRRYDCGEPLKNIVTIRE